MTKASDYPQTPEAVALALLERIILKDLGMDRSATLDLYAECLAATKGDRRPDRKIGRDKPATD